MMRFLARKIISTLDMIRYQSFLVANFRVPEYGYPRTPSCYNTKAGHSGGLPVSQQIENVTDELSSLFGSLG